MNEQPDSAEVPTMGGAGAAFRVACLLSVFASAVLVFVAEPMVARQLLPRFGGSPAIWNTAVVFYQALLLAGYAYAHWSVKRLGLRRQMLLHTAVLLAPLLLLPPVPRAGLDAPATEWPFAWLVLALLTAIGLPLFVLSSNASLVQLWWSASRATDGRDPYRLYAVSNTGSLIALLAFPLLIERFWGTSGQTRWWSAGYLLFVLVTGLVMWLTRRTMMPVDRSGPATAGNGRMVGGDGLAPVAESSGQELVEAAAASDPLPASDLSPGAADIDRRRRLRWLVLAAVPASLLLSTTLAITTDIVSVPLLWVIPLAIYLLTYIVAFAVPERLPRSWIAAATALSVVAGLLLPMLHSLEQQSTWLLLAAALAPLLFGGLLCHLDLARDRPHPARLTEFYLWLALGGVIGGALNSLVAPLLFDTVAEYPLTLVLLACLVSPSGLTSLAADLRATLRGPRAIHLVVILVAVSLATWQLIVQGEHSVWWLAVLLAALAYSLLIARPPWPYFAVAAAAVGLVAAAGIPQVYQVEAQGRSFFGVVQVLKTSWGRAMRHGTTIHGMQAADPSRRLVPVTYYFPTGPLGSAVRAVPADGRIGVVGLGTGALASLTQAGQTLDYFEIDPLVADLARRYFTFLDEAAGQVNIHLGDGRLELERVPDQSFDLLVIDAFTSDSIPVHLLTAEAIELYRRKVKPTGLVVLHLSNQHLDLRRVATGWVRQGGRLAAYQPWRPTDAELAQGAAPTRAVAVAPDDATIQRLIDGSGGLWTALPADGPAVSWTDDFTNILSVWRR